MATEDTDTSADAIRRMAQIITQKFNLPAASASIERAKRIFTEMVAPQQLALRQAEAEVTILRAENIRLQEDRDRLINELRAAKEGVS